MRRTPSACEEIPAYLRPQATSFAERVSRSQHLKDETWKHHMFTIERYTRVYVCVCDVAILSREADDVTCARVGDNFSLHARVNRN